MKAVAQKKLVFFPPYGTGIVKVFVKMITPQSFKDIKADRRVNQIVKKRRIREKEL